MHLHSFVAAGFAASVVSLSVAIPAVAHADWAVGGNTGRRDMAPPSPITPPGPFLQPAPDSYLYPRPVYPQPPPTYPQQQPRHDQTWQERQWRESQWQGHHTQPAPDWRDWSQHDRNDRGSRDREGRDRDRHDRPEQGSQFERGGQGQGGPDAGRNVPTWDYRENHR